MAEAIIVFIVIIALYLSGLMKIWRKEAKNKPSSYITKEKYDKAKIFNRKYTSNKGYK